MEIHERTSKYHWQVLCCEKLDFCLHGIPSAEGISLGGRFIRNSSYRSEKYDFIRLMEQDSTGQIVWVKRRIDELEDF